MNKRENKLRQKLWALGYTLRVRREFCKLSKEMNKLQRNNKFLATDISWKKRLDVVNSLWGMASLNVDRAMAQEKEAL